MGETFQLSAEVVREPETPKDSTLVRAELCDSAGEVLSEADYEYIVLPADRFLGAVGISELPDAYQRHFGERR